MNLGVHLFYSFSYSPESQGPEKLRLSSTDPGLCELEMNVGSLPRLDFRVTYSGSGPWTRTLPWLEGAELRGDGLTDHKAYGNDENNWHWHRGKSECEHLAEVEAEKSGGSMAAAQMTAVPGQVSDAWVTL